MEEKIDLFKESEGLLYQEDNLLKLLWSWIGRFCTDNRQDRRWRCVREQTKVQGRQTYCSLQLRDKLGYTWRLRLGEKLEFIDWDPLLNQEVLCREDKKVKSRLKLGKSLLTGIRSWTRRFCNCWIPKWELRISTNCWWRKKLICLRKVEDFCIHLGEGSFRQESSHCSVSQRIHRYWDCWGG